jgi:hypothetical protein
MSARHAGAAALASSVTQSELAPASMRLALLGSRMNGAMKFACLVALAPQYRALPSSGRASVMPLQMYTEGAPLVERCSAR